MSVSNEYVRELLAENSKLKKKIQKLEAKLASRKQKDLDPKVVQDRKERMRARWVPGGENYHNSKIYKAMTIAELSEYHSKYPDAEIGPRYTQYLMDQGETSEKKRAGRAKKAE